MRVTYTVILIATVLVLVNSFPAEKDGQKKTTDRTEIDFVPLEVQGSGGLYHGDQPVIDVDAGSDFGNPFFANPFSDFFAGVGDMLTRMRQQLNQILGRLPTRPMDDSPFPELHLPHIGDVDLSKGNTTSVTKVIDGHKVIINETTYNSEGENSGAFFKVRIIDVHPNDEVTERDSEKVTTNTKNNKELIDDGFDNEIPKKSSEDLFNFDNIETFDEVDAFLPPKFPSPTISKPTEWDDIKPIGSIEDNNIESYGSNSPEPIRDLSNDIYINELMADAGVPPNPDAEIFDTVNPPASVPIKYEDYKSAKIIR